MATKKSQHSNLYTSDISLFLPTFYLPEVEVTAKRPNLFYVDEGNFGPGYSIISEEFNPSWADFGGEIGRSIYMTPSGNDTVYYGYPNNILYIVNGQGSFLSVPINRDNQEQYRNKFYKASIYAKPESKKDDAETLNRIRREYKFNKNK